MSPSPDPGRSTTYTFSPLSCPSLSFSLTQPRFFFLSEYYYFLQHSWPGMHGYDKIQTMSSAFLTLEMLSRTPSGDTWPITVTFLLSRSMLNDVTPALHCIASTLSVMKNNPSMYPRAHKRNNRISSTQSRKSQLVMHVHIFTTVVSLHSDGHCLSYCAQNHAKRVAQCCYM